MKNIKFFSMLALVLLLFTNSAFASNNTKTLPTLSAGSAISKSDLFLTRQGTDTVDKKVTGQQLLAFISSNSAGLVASVCSLFTDATTCARQLGYADPRQFGATCGSSFNTNNNTADDAPGINAALATGMPVMIPHPGCKIASQVSFPTITNDMGGEIFSFASGDIYNSNYPARPYLFIPNNIWNNTTNNCAFDTKGLDNVTFRNINMRGNWDSVGSVGICNSVGLSTACGGSACSASFLNLYNVSFLNMGAGFGAAMTSVLDPAYASSNPCTPTGTLMNPVFQVRGKGVNFIGTCMGAYGNFSDMHMSDVYAANVRHNTFSSTGAFGSAWNMDKLRIEFSGFGGHNGTIFQEGTGLYFGGPYGYTVSDLACDRTYGPCVTAGPGSRSVLLDNMVITDSWYTAKSGITDRCHIALLGTTGFSASNISAVKNNNNTPNVVCDNTRTLAPNTFTGSISGTTLTVSGFNKGRLHIGSTITGAGVAPNTRINAWNSGTGGNGTYTVNNSQTVSSTEMSFANNYVSLQFTAGSSLPEIGGYSTSFFGLSEMPFVRDFRIPGLINEVSGTLTKLSSLSLPTAGDGLLVKEGSNATMGIATLSGGTVTVNTTKVTATSRIYLTTNGGTLTNVGTPYISARSAGTSFTITSTNASDASNVAWFIIEPAP